MSWFAGGETSLGLWSLFLLKPGRVQGRILPESVFGRNCGERKGKVVASPQAKAVVLLIPGQGPVAVALPEMGFQCL